MVVFTADPKPELANQKAELVNAFYESGSFKQGHQNGFKLSSGESSPYYVDCKCLMADPQHRERVAQLAFDKIKDLQFECIGGMEIGAIAISTVISDFFFRVAPERKRKTFVVRKKAKEHGLQKQVEGFVQRDHRAIIVDDVLTSGGSMINAIRAAKDAGLEVKHALVIVDRQEQEGKKNVEQEGVSLISLLTLDDLKAKSPT